MMMCQSIIYHLSILQVKVWFQNRRTKHKREQQEQEQQQQQQKSKSGSSSSSTNGSGNGGGNTSAGLSGGLSGGNGGSGQNIPKRASESPLMHHPHLNLTGPSSSMAAAAMAAAMRNYPGLTHYDDEDLSDEEIDCDS